jgi:hypothetical protein
VSVNLARESKDSKTKTSENFHVAQNLLAEIVRHLNQVAGIVGVDSADLNHTLHCALGEGRVFSSSVVLHDYRHTLDVRIKGELSDVSILWLFPMGALDSAPAETGRQDLNGWGERVQASARGYHLRCGHWSFHDPS